MFDPNYNIGQTVKLSNIIGEKMNDKQKLRQTAILSAAKILFIKFGYDKTSVADIAKQAGISKGAIYLHFNSKDELFETLLTTQMAKFSYVWMAYVEADPKGGTMAGIYINMLHAMHKDSFITAMMSQDGQFFGSYLYKPNSLFKQQYQQNTRQEFVKMMQQVGCVRKELDPFTTAHIMNIISHGLVSIGQVMDKAAAPPIEDTIATLADIMDRALTPDDGGNSEAGKQVLRQIFKSSIDDFTNKYGIDPNDLKTT